MAFLDFLLVRHLRRSILFRRNSSPLAKLTESLSHINAALIELNFVYIDVLHAYKSAVSKFLVASEIS
jgi:hypothetical protein